jgi:DNA-binding transcriptional MerR regulator
MDGHMGSELAIGQLSTLTSCKVSTIRWYEQAGLIPKPQRTAGNQRRYTQQHVMLLHFILNARTLGFDLNAIRQLLHLVHCSQHKPHEADAIAKQHLQEITQRIEKLKSLEHALTQMIINCQTGKAHECNVLQVLAKSAT